MLFLCCSRQTDSHPSDVTVGDVYSYLWCSRWLSFLGPDSSCLISFPGFIQELKVVPVVKDGVLVSSSVSPRTCGSSGDNVASHPCRATEAELVVPVVLLKESQSSLSYY